MLTLQIKSVDEFQICRKGNSPFSLPSKIELYFYIIRILIINTDFFVNF